MESDVIIKSAIIDGASILKRRFISSADLDSEILMAEAIKKKREFLILNSNFDLNFKLSFISHQFRATLLIQQEILILIFH